MEENTLKIVTDIHCEVYVDYEFVGISIKNQMTRLTLKRAEYLIKLVSTVNPNLVMEDIVNLEYDKVLKCSFSELTKQRLELIRECDLRFSREHHSFVDLITKTVLPYTYDDANNFKEGLSCAKKDGKYGFINSSGEVIIPFIYDFATDFENGLARVRLKDKGCGALDKSGKIIIPCVYDSVYSTKNEFIIVQKNNKYGWVNKFGVEIVPCIYDSPSKYRYSSDFKLHTRNKDYISFIDFSGNETRINGDYEDYSGFTNGYARVKKNGKWGLIDCNGVEVVPCRYDYIESFHNNLALVRINNKSGFPVEIQAQPT